MVFNKSENVETEDTPVTVVPDTLAELTSRRFSCKHPIGLVPSEQVPLTTLSFTPIRYCRSVLVLSAGLKKRPVPKKTQELLELSRVTVAAAVTGPRSIGEPPIVTCWTMTVGIRVPAAFPGIPHVLPEDPDTVSGLQGAPEQGPIMRR